MFGNFFSRKRAASGKPQPASGFQVNFGEAVDDWERLVSASRKKDVEIEGAIHDVWTLVFERHTFMLFMHSAADAWGGDAMNSSLRLAAAYYKEEEAEEFEPAIERFWFRQLDQMLELLPKLDSV